MDKREARQEYKLKKTPQGVFAIRCLSSGQAWLGPSTHLDSEQNSAWFQLRLGQHRNSRLQAAWNAHGEDAFTYQILETFEDDVAPLLLKNTFTERLEHWQSKYPEAERLDAWRP